MLWLTRTCAPKIQIRSNSADALYAIRRSYSSESSSSNDEASTSITAVSTTAGNTRPRQYGNKSLPLSPLLSAEYEEATQRYKRAKPAQDEHFLTEFQEELALNPYAHALATDIRQCSLTLARLPRHFLLPFSTRISHPPHPPKPNPQPNQRPWPNKPLAVLQPVSYRDAPRGTETITTNSYLLNRLDALEQADRHGHWRALVTDRMRQKLAPVVQRSHKGIVAKEWWMWTKGEMTGLVREHLEKEAMAAVERVTEYQDEELLDTDEEDGDCTVLLRLSSSEESSSDTARPVYDLPSLISPSNTALQNLQARYEVDSFTVARHDSSVRMRNALDRLVQHLESNALVEDLAEKQRIRTEIRFRKSQERIAREQEEIDRDLSDEWQEPGADPFADGNRAGR